jgi:hypothetical protein
MIMNTNTNRILEHLNIFSIDYYKQQQQQQQYDEMKMNMPSDQHGKHQIRDYHIRFTLCLSVHIIINTNQPIYLFHTCVCVYI